MLIEFGNPFTDPGASALDDYDGVINTVLSSGTVDTSTVGTYTLFYEVSDAAGNSAIRVSRNVIVGSPPTITLQGDNPMTVDFGDPYNEPGATAFDLDDGSLGDTSDSPSQI